MTLEQALYLETDEGKRLEISVQEHIAGDKPVKPVKPDGLSQSSQPRLSHLSKSLDQAISASHFG